MSEASEDNSQPLCPECHHVQLKIPAISFTAKDMLLKDNKHDRPLYYTGYIGSTCIERVQVEPGSALSIIPKKAPLLSWDTAEQIINNDYYDIWLQCRK